MSDFVMVPSLMVQLSRRERMRERRPATEIEALLELQAMVKVYDMPPSMNQLAQSFGWSPGRLRRAFDRWQADCPTLTLYRPRSDRT